MTKALMCFFLLGLGCLFSRSTYAAYPAAKSNHDLHEELNGDSDRIISPTEKFAAAVDGHVFVRLDGTEEFYHGIGHWTQLRTEIIPRPHLKINLRTILYAGSVSFGYTDPSGFYNLLGVSGIWPNTIFGGQLTGRILDIERQTVGHGLMVQEREFAGLYFKWQKDDWSFLWRADGTGALLIGDDTHNFELAGLDGWLGAGTISWPAGVEQSGLAKPRAPYFYGFTGHTFSNFSFGIEVGSRDTAQAGLIFGRFKDTIGGLKLDLRAEAREYQDRFGADFVSQIQQMYISYDQLDKSYTNAMSIFWKDDNVSVYSGKIDLQYKLSHSWKFESLNEVGQFAFKAIAPENFYFYRAAVDHCPSEASEDCLSFFVSNKVLTNSFSVPPHGVSLNNRPLFKNVPLTGIEANFRF